MVNTSTPLSEFGMKLRISAILSLDVLTESAQRVKKEMERVRITFETLKESEKNIMVAG